MIIGRSIEVGLLFILVFVFKYIYKKQFLSHVFNTVFVILYLTSLINIIESNNTPTDLIGLEISYIILIICHCCYDKMLKKIILNASIIIT